MKIDFLYHAEAVAASGHLTLPIKESMEIQASIALPVIGGHGSVRAENFHHRHYLSFRRAESHVVGSFSDHDHAHGTLATTTVEGLNIMDMVTCDRIVARITTKHPDKTHPPDKREKSFVALGSRFENLRIAGHLIDVKLATGMFAEHNNWRKLGAAHVENEKDRDELKKLSHLKPKNGGFPESNGMAVYTLYSNPEDLPRGLTWNGRGIHVEHFGTIYLAEYYLTESYHRLLMLHVDLGCSVEGCFGIGGAGGNGVPPSN